MLDLRLCGFTYVATNINDYDCLREIDLREMQRIQFSFISENPFSKFRTFFLVIITGHSKNGPIAQLELAVYDFVLSFETGGAAERNNALHVCDYRGTSLIVSDGRPYPAI